MLRRGVGIGALQQRQQIESTFKKQGEAIAESQLATINRQLALFKTALEEFARKHRSRINKNPEFRAQFQQLCASVGVDPLASAKGFWAKTLGLGDFYNELGVQILDVCLSTRSQNGGLIEMRELCRLLMRMRGPKSDAISQDDVERSLRKLKCLGGNLTILTVGDHRVVQSVPVELNMDHLELLRFAKASGAVFSKTAVRRELGWNPERIDHALQMLLQEEMAMIDDQDPSHERMYWFVGLLESAAPPGQPPSPPPTR